MQRSGSSRKKRTKRTVFNPDASFLSFSACSFPEGNQKEILLFPLRNNYNICNEGKHIEIFQKEVSIFSTCLRLSEQMLTSFRKTPALPDPNTGFRTSKACFLRKKGPVSALPLLPFDLNRKRPGYSPRDILLFLTAKRRKRYQNESHSPFIGHRTYETRQPIRFHLSADKYYQLDFLLKRENSPYFCIGNK